MTSHSQPPPTVSSRSRPVLPAALQVLSAFFLAHRDGLGSLLEKECADYLSSRIDQGIATYGRELATHNGRDAMEDARQEIADALLCLTQLIQELEARVAEGRALQDQDEADRARLAGSRLVLVQDMRERAARLFVDMMELGKAYEPLLRPQRPERRVFGRGAPPPELREGMLLREPACGTVCIVGEVGERVVMLRVRGAEVLHEARYVRTWELAEDFIEGDVPVRGVLDGQDRAQALGRVLAGLALARAVVDHEDAEPRPDGSAPFIEAKDWHAWLERARTATGHARPAKALPAGGEDKPW